MGWVVFAGWPIPAAVAESPEDLTSSVPARSPIASVDVSASTALDGRWVRWPTVGAYGGEPRAVAGAPGGDVAAGDESGVTWLRRSPASGAPIQRRASLEDVRVLAFDDSGALWIGTGAGLFRWDWDERPRVRPLRGGEAAREIFDLAVSGSALLVSTRGGAYWSSRGSIFQPLSIAGESQAVVRGAVLAAVEGEPTEVWLLRAQALDRIRGWVTPTGLRVLDRRRFDPPRLDPETQRVELLLDPAKEGIAVVFDVGIATRAWPADEVGVPGADLWRIERPQLSPGARIRARRRVGDLEFWATDHGVYTRAGRFGPYARAQSPIGRSDCLDLAGGGQALLTVYCRAGLFSFESRSEGSVQVATRPDFPDLDSASSASYLSASGSTFKTGSALSALPPLAEIRAHALREAGLSAERAAGLWRGLRRRAYWPELALRVGVDVDRDDSREADQAFVSGDTRFLQDRTRDQGRAIEASIALDWDLGGLVYPFESVDLSRELRQVVSLRDDIADEIHQLYFERARIADRLRRDDLPEATSRESLALRAEEIDAGLDAWSGGWITRWRGGQSPRGRPPGAR